MLPVANRQDRAFTCLRVTKSRESRKKVEKWRTVGGGQLETNSGNLEANSGNLEANRGNLEANSGNCLSTSVVHPPLPPVVDPPSTAVWHTSYTAVRAPWHRYCLPGYLRYCSLATSIIVSWLLPELDFCSRSVTSASQSVTSASRSVRSVKARLRL